MNPALEQIPERILKLALGALTQANTHAAYLDPGNEHWQQICVLNAAHAGELFIKAVIAKEHPLLIFKDLFNLDDSKAEILDIDALILRGRTHDFERLPQVLWATTDRRIPNPECFEKLRKARNAIQHFCAPEQADFQDLSLEFIYTIIDPLIFDAFGLFAIEYHEDHVVGYDYIVGALLRSEIKFSIPHDFHIGEIDMREELFGASAKYTDWIRSELNKVGRMHLIS
ncbi:MAG: hypothetical protein ACXIVL_12645 [Oceanicaulis sp.]